MGRKRVKYQQAMTKDDADPTRHLLEHYSNRHDWLKDSHFLKELEGDSVDTEVLDEELNSIQDQTPKTCRGRALVTLESNPFQIALCVLVLLDAGVVVAEILLDLHAIRSQYEHSQVMLDQAAQYLKYSYGDILDGYGTADMQHILSTLQYIYANNATYAKTRTKRSTHSDTSNGVLLHDYAHPLYGSNNDTNLDIMQQLSTSNNKYNTTQDRTDDINNEKMDVFLSKDTDRPAENSVTHSQFAQEILKSTSQRSNDASTEAHILSRIAREAVDTYNDTSSTYPKLKPKMRKHEGYTYAEKLLKISHMLHYCSIAILAVFVLQFLIKMVCMGAEFFRDKLEMFDAVIITASFCLDIVFLEGSMNDSTGEEAAALLIVFLLWRLLRVVNGLMVTSKKRQEFRIKLQKRARRKAERRIEHLEDEKQLHQKEIHSLKDLCIEKGALEMEIVGCKPRKFKSVTVEKMNTSAGLSSIAALSLGFSMSMSGASNASPISNGSMDRPSYPGMPGYQLHNLMMGGANHLATPKGRSPKRRAFLSVMRYKKKTLGSSPARRSQDRFSSDSVSCQTKSFEFSPQTSVEVVSPLEMSEDKSDDTASTHAQTIQTQQSSLDSANIQVSIDIETEQCWIENESETIDSDSSSADETAQKEPADASKLSQADVTSQESHTSIPIESYQENTLQNSPKCDTNQSSVNSANKRLLFANRSYPSIGKIFRNGGTCEALSPQETNHKTIVKQEAIETMETDKLDTLVIGSNSTPNRRSRGQSCHTIMQRKDYV